MTYEQKLNETKDQYPFDQWREAFDDGLTQYTQANCDRIKHIFDALIADLIKAGEQASEADKVKLFEKAILQTNVLSEEIDDLIETGEREDLCALTNVITIAAGLDPEKYGEGEGLATEWREW